MQKKKEENKLEELVNYLKKFKADEIQQALSILKISVIAEKKEEKVEDLHLEEMTDEFKAKSMKIFNAADKDKSGTIDEVELNQLLKELIGPISLAESNLIYSEMDSNHSGTITFDEFTAGLLKYKWDTSKIEERDSSIEEWEIPMKEITLEKKLGEGIFGTVYRAKWRGSTVACKKLKNPDVHDELSDFKKEISIIGKLRHPNVLLFLGSVTGDKNNMCILTEYMEGGNLHEVIHEKKVRFDFRSTMGLMKQTAFGLNYLHLSNIIHRDLKLANLLVDRFYNVKLSDFGLSCIKKPNSEITEAVGSPLWRAPELLLSQPYNQAADIYSFSLCCWELLSLEQPYLDIEEWDQLVSEVAVQGKRPTVPSFCPAELNQLLRLSWDQDANKRPNCAQIIAQLERISNFSS